MARSLRLLLAFLVLGPALFGGIAAPAAADPDPVVDGSAYLGACTQSARSLSVLFVLDRSGSLGGADATDPDGVRYDGLKVALDRIAQLRDGNGDPFPSEVAVAAFSDAYSPAKDVVDWTSLNGERDEPETIIDHIVEDTRERTAPRGNTDFDAALTGGYKDFTGHLGPTNCRVMVWFTDGEFSTKSGDQDARAAQMCAPGGVLDTIRQNGIVLVGVQLHDDSEYLAPMSLGEANGSTCGTQPLPEGWAPGIYLQADNTPGLRRIFGRLAVAIEGCTPLGDSMVVDAGIRRMQVEIDEQGNTPITGVSFDGADGVSFTVPAQGTTETHGYTVAASRDEDYISMDVALPANASGGEWQITPQPSSARASHIELCVLSDLRLLAVPGLPRSDGTDALVQLQVVDSEGKPASLEPFVVSAGPGAVTAAQGGDSRPVGTVDVQAPEGRLTIPVAVQPSDARLDMRAQIGLTTQSGVKLTPLSLTWGQGITLPRNYPRIEPIDQLDLGIAFKTERTSATVKLIGSADGPTQVCFDEPEGLHAPTSAASVTTFTSSEDWGCVDLAAGETQEVTIGVGTDEASVGDASASLPVRLVSAKTADTPSETAAFDLPVVWRFTDPTNLWLTTVVVIVTALLSAVLPVLAIGLAGWWAAKYQVRGLRAVSTEVRAGRDGIVAEHPLPNVAPTRVINGIGLVPVGGLRGNTVRRFEHKGLRFRSVSRLKPWRAPKFWVEPPAGSCLVSSTSAAGDPADGSRATVPPGLGLVAVLVCDRELTANPDLDTITGTLVVFTKKHLTGEQLDDLALPALDIAEFRRNLQSGPTTDITHTPSSPPPDPDDPWT